MGEMEGGGPLVPAWGPADCAVIGQRPTECAATIGCEYCSLGPDGRNLGEDAFCAPMGVCFGGVVAAASPYSGISSNIPRK